MTRSKFLCGVGLALALALGASSASADLITYDLNIANSAISPYPAPYGTVDVNRTSSTSATVTLTAVNTAPYFYGFGDGGTLGLNVSGTFTGSVTTWTNLQGSSTPTVTSAGNEDGFGSFNFRVNNGTGAGDALSSLTVELTATGTTTWADAASVLTLNNKDFLVAAHLFVFESQPSGNTPALATGFVGNGEGPPPVPEPSSMAIAGLGALGFLAYGLRRRVK